MTFFQDVILGIIQGLTEFLPVSSSGHLVLFQNLFGMEEPNIFFDICVHIGTLLAVIVVFYKELWEMLREVFRHWSRFLTPTGWHFLYFENAITRTVLLIVIASIPTAIIGFCFSKIAHIIFGQLWLVGVFLLLTGTFLWLTRKITSGHRKARELTIKDALIIGTCQGVAVLPGISRSGATISVALARGVQPSTAGRFSFLLSIPAILGSFILEFDTSIFQSNTIWLEGYMAAGIAAGFVGFLALMFLLKVIDKGRLYLFSPYCWAIGTIALILGLRTF